MRRSVPIAIFAALLLACSPSDSETEAETGEQEVVFQVDPQQLGDPYALEEHQLRLRPPTGWVRLEDSERDALAAGVTARQQDSDIRLAVQDLFLHTETFSYLAVSTLRRNGEPLVAADVYSARLREQLSEREDEISSVSRFTVNGTEIEQFRFFENERVNFLLLVADDGRQALQIDYSIPVAAFEEQVRKLESSIGTIERR